VLGSATLAPRRLRTPYFNEVDAAEFSGWGLMEHGGLGTTPKTQILWTPPALEKPRQTGDTTDSSKWSSKLNGESANRLQRTIGARGGVPELPSGVAGERAYWREGL